MTAPVLKYAIGNHSSTTEANSISNTSITLPIDSDTNFKAKSGEGMVLIDEATATEETAYATGITGSILDIPLANRGLEGGIPQAHALGAVVKGVLTAGMWNAVIDALTNVVYKTTGLLDITKVVDLATSQTLTNKTLTSPTINTPTISSPTVTGTPVLNSDSAVPFYTDGILRNVVINGSFDVWQRGTSFTYTDSSWHWTADRWLFCNNSATNANENIDQWDVSGSYNFDHGIRLKRNAGATYASSSYITQAFETDTSKRFRGKKVTLSFYVLCGADYAGGNVSVAVYTGTGTDEKSAGNFTGASAVINQAITPTTSWVKYTYSSATLSTTFTQLGVIFGISGYSGTAGTNDTLYFTQIQLHEGDVALPYIPKTYPDELGDCQRFYEKSYDYATAPGTNTATGSHVMESAGGASTIGNYIQDTVNFKVTKRASGTTTCYDRVGASEKVTLKNADASNTDNISGTCVTSENSVNVYAVTTATTQRGLLFNWACDAEMTAGG